MDAFMAAHPRGKYGTVGYELTAFSVDASERRGALRFYQQRFDIPSEEQPYSLGRRNDSVDRARGLTGVQRCHVEHAFRVSDQRSGGPI